MTRRKYGRITLCIGAIILLVSLLLIFKTTSVWAIITLGISLVVNTVGLSMLLIRDPEDD